MRQSLLITAFAALLPSFVSGQCAGDEMYLTMEVASDDWGYEGYWQLVPAGSDCGTDMIAEGGNIVQVGCSGGGDQDATPGNGYDDNNMVVEDIGCLAPGFYDLIYVDDWGDGGLDFTLILDGIYPMYHFAGTGVGATFTFEVTSPPDYDAAAEDVELYPYYQPGPIDISVSVTNMGANTITDLELSYTINGGLPVTTTISGLDITPFEHAELTHNIPWSPTENGEYEVVLTSGNVNGNADAVVENNSAEMLVTIGDAKPDILEDYLYFLTEQEVIGGPADGISIPTDLDFHPVLSDYQVWVVNRGTEGTGGSTVTFWNAGEAEQTSLWKQDGNAWHFMSLPTGIAFSNNSNFSTSPGVKDANHSGGTFTGPTLWSSDMDIYAEPSGGNGSHLDMLHQSPFTMGICADQDNAFYAFCDWHGHIHYYDFVEDHGPGNADHSDGIVRKYTDFDVSKINQDLPCHLALDENREWLYIVDGGSQRILKMNTTTGNIVDDWEPANGEPLAESSSVVGVEYYEIVTEGLIEPVGVDVKGDRMVVSDHATGEIIFYDITTVPATELTRIATGRDGVMGLVIGPDGLIWFVDNETDELVRLNLSKIVSVSDQDLPLYLQIYPNPADDQVTVTYNQLIKPEQILLFNNMGQQVFAAYEVTTSKIVIPVSALPSGSYQLVIQYGSTIEKSAVVIQH